MKHISRNIINYAGSAFSRYKLAAQFYCHRPRWSPGFIKLAIESASEKDLPELMIADIGAGDGGPGRVMVEIGCDPKNIFQVEPNEEMRNLNREKGGLNVVPGSSSQTFLPAAKFHIVTYFNSVHQISPQEVEQTLRENQKILKPDGKIIFAAQRFDPDNILIQEIHGSCEDWKKRGLYPDYGDNGHKFILESQSGAANAKAILDNYAGHYTKENRQEVTLNNSTKYNKEEFTGLFRSYLSFPTSPQEELTKEIEKLHDKHSDNQGCVTIHCVQVAIVGDIKAKEKEQGASRF